MSYEKIRKIFERNQKTKSNTYLVPIRSFDGFTRDELMYVKKADNESCTVWRSMDGRLYNLSSYQMINFKCIGDCNC